MRNQGCLLYVTFLLCPVSLVHSYIWAWMYSLPYNNPSELAFPKDSGTAAPSPEPTVQVCSPKINCHPGFFCDHHFGLCLALRQEGQYCRQDAHCARGLNCMFGKCHPVVPSGQEGARCHQDADCSSNACCARLHGELVCKQRLRLGEGCYIPQGGIAFSLNQVCPCLPGLVCRGQLPNRELAFEYWPDKSDWRCQKN